MRKIGLTCLALWAGAPTSFAAERFSGSAAHSANEAQTSNTVRFSVSAELQAAPATAKTTSDGRFSVLAELAAAKSSLTACGPVLDPIFKNGFEN